MRGLFTDKFSRSMIRGVVKYWDLGRGKAKGQVTIEASTTEEFNIKMLKAFKNHLLSQNISFDNGDIRAPTGR